jgi:hypothetical protein
VTVSETPIYEVLTCVVHWAVIRGIVPVICGDIEHLGLLVLDGQRCECQLRSPANIFWGSIHVGRWMWTHFTIHSRIECRNKLEHELYGNKEIERRDNSLKKNQ